MAAILPALVTIAIAIGIMVFVVNSKNKRK